MRCAYVGLLSITYECMADYFILAWHYHHSSCIIKLRVWTANIALSVLRSKQFKLWPMKNSLSHLVAADASGADLAHDKHQRPPIHINTVYFMFFNVGISTSPWYISSPWCVPFCAFCVCMARCLCILQVHATKLPYWMNVGKQASKTSIAKLRHEQHKYMLLCCLRSDTYMHEQAAAAAAADASAWIHKTLAASHLPRE